MAIIIQVIGNTICKMVMGHSLNVLKESTLVNGKVIKKLVMVNITIQTGIITMVNGRKINDTVQVYLYVLMDQFTMVNGLRMNGVGKEYFIITLNVMMDNGNIVPKMDLEFNIGKTVKYRQEFQKLVCLQNETLTKLLLY